MDILNAWWDIIRDGVHHINPIQFVIIGVIFGLMANSLVSVVFGSLAASAIYVAVNALKPVVFDHQPFVWPAMNSAFWHFFLSLYFAFLVVTAVFFIGKSIIEGIRG